MTGCKKTTDGSDLYKYDDRKPSTCINGWKYFSSGKGVALYINTHGNPEGCK